MSNIIYNSTDDNPVEGTIYINGSIQVIPSGSTIIAYVADLARSTKIISDLTINEGDAGNDWTNGVIKGVFPKASCAALSSYDGKHVLVVVQVTIGGQTESFTKEVHANKLL